ALLSLVIAFGLWLYVITVVSPGSEDTYSNIPVVLQNEGMLQERGLMITTQELPTVTLRLAGNRTDLNKLNSSNITVYVNVAAIGVAGEHSLPYSVSYPGDVPNNAITTQSRKPDTVKLTVEERVSKTVPVVPVYEGTVPEGFIADKENCALDYEEIQISGPARVIAQIAEARVRVELEGKNESINESLAYTLCNKDGAPVDVAMVTTNVEAVNLTLRIMRVKELALKLTVISGGGATEQTSQIKVNPETILVSGSEALLDDLTELNLGTIDLAEHLTDTTLTLPIKLPAEVTNETGVAEATVDIRFPNLRTKTLSISQINAVNVPEGMKAEIITKVLEIRFRGPKALIDSMQAADVTVNVNFSEAQAGTATMRAEVIMADKYKEVGAVGSYSVSATLR
ncbi:MAG: hypothetical protein J6A74_05615, partial [Oscillospiraceae bacterium]|nr:hypothetical protein [Oscillospiraceae bacterium]